MNKQLIRKDRGFTMIEVMIVAVIIGVLAAMAYPAYQNYVRESRRTTAQTALLELAGQQEDYFSKNLQYSTILQPGWGAGTVDYILSISNPGGVTTFQVTASVDMAGRQRLDRCGMTSATNCCTSLAIDQTGRRISNPAANSKCWGVQL